MKARILAIAIVIAAGCWDRAVVAESPVERYVVLMDCSGSVNEIWRAKGLDFARRFLAGRPGAECALMVFADRIETVLDFGSPERLNGLKIDFTSVRKRTLLYDAIFEASRMMERNRVPYSALLVFTDGRDVGSDLLPADSIRVCLDKGIPMYAFGVGSRIDEKSLRRLSRLSGGLYQGLASASDSDSGLAALQKSIPQPLPKVGGAPVVESSAPVEPPSGAKAPARAAQVESESHWGFIIVLAIAIPALAAVASVFLLRKRRQGIQCPTCGSIMDGYFAECPVCRGVPLPPQPAPVAPQPTPPVVQETDEEPAPLSEADYPARRGAADTLDTTVVMLETPVLIVKKGKSLGAVYPVPWSGTLDIGRSRSNNIVIEDRTSSGKHCRLKHDGERFSVYDLKSTNGTFLNDRKIIQAYLKDGDTIQVGDTHFLFKVQRLST